MTREHSEQTSESIGDIHAPSLSLRKVFYNLYRVSSGNERTVTAAFTIFLQLPITVILPPCGLSVLESLSRKD